MDEEIKPWGAKLRAPRSHNQKSSDQTKALLKTCHSTFWKLCSVSHE